MNHNVQLSLYGFGPNDLKNKNIERWIFRKCDLNLAYWNILDYLINVTELIFLDKIYFLGNTQAYVHHWECCWPGHSVLLQVYITDIYFLRKDSNIVQWCCHRFESGCGLNKCDPNYLQKSLTGKQKIHWVQQREKGRGNNVWKMLLTSQKKFISYKYSKFWLKIWEAQVYSPPFSRLCLCQSDSVIWI